MSVVAEFTVGIDDFPLGPAVSTTGTSRIELERVVPTAGEAIPSFWVWSDDVRSFVTRADEHPGVAAVSVLTRLDDSALCRVRWNDDYRGLVAALVESEVTVLETTTGGDHWRLRVRATDREGISTFFERCRSYDVDIDVRRLAPERPPGTQDGLTAGQREILRLAFEHGYFEEPRESSLADLAAELDISRQAVGARLRRAYGNLVESSIVRTRRR